MSNGATRFRPFGVWQLRSVQAVSGDDPESHARYLLSQLAPVSSSIDKYLADPDCYVDIRLWIESTSPTLGITILGDTMARLARLCKEVNITFIAGDGGQRDV